MAQLFASLSFSLQGPATCSTGAVRVSELVPDLCSNQSFVVASDLLSTCPSEFRVAEIRRGVSAATTFFSQFSFFSFSIYVFRKNGPHLGPPKREVHIFRFPSLPRCIATASLQSYSIAKARRATAVVICSTSGYKHYAQFAAQTLFMVVPRTLL